jgi:hypothetical protein
MSDFRNIPRKAVTLTKSDSTNIRGVGAVFVGTTGDVHVRNLEGDTVIFKNVANGATLITGEIDRLMNATTAADVVGFYIP